ncbi:hypothetical protein RJ641_008136 [Dillenia turbinata]|uniref:C2H2-type domain-containing protein n=1 Tax=Dillenia turbinata TaxID=194707 RepID=A0AAN8Z660_9MAGN
MEKHRCKLCFRVFANGRAMGGHMRSHMAILPVPVPPKVPQIQKFTEPVSGLIQHPSVTKSVEPELEKQYQANPALVPFVQDSESEAESSRNPTGKRSKRPRKLVMLSDDSSPAEPEPEPVSSLSESLDAEDAALCLLELSKVKWVKPQDNQSTEIDSTSGSSGQDPIRGVYRCELCNKDFKSYQALGGHKANHKKLNVQANEANNGGGNGNGRTFECPFCFRVFGSGQAMGGHKKCHYNNGPKAAAATPPAASAATTSANYRDNKNQFDLNLPAPQFDDDDAELSAVSNADNFYSFK